MNKSCDGALTDERTDELRRTVPDDPVPLPPNSLPCEGCGVAVTGPVTNRMVPLPPRPLLVPEGRPVPPGSVWEFGRCEPCSDLHHLANVYTDERPELVGRYGTIVRDRIETVLMGLTVIGKPIPTDLQFLLPRLLTPASQIRFMNPLATPDGKCSPWPWSHVTLKQRRALQLAYVQLGRDRLALNEPPVEIRCPSKGCLLCGIPAVSRSAIEVQRRGGLAVTRRAMWTPRGGGHACPDCDEAIRREGALGASAMDRAVHSFVKTTSERKARRLRSFRAHGEIPELPPWSAQPNPAPNITRFQHLRRLIDRL